MINPIVENPESCDDDKRDKDRSQDRDGDSSSRSIGFPGADTSATDSEADGLEAPAGPRETMPKMPGLTPRAATGDQPSFRA